MEFTAEPLLKAAVFSVERRRYITNGASITRDVIVHPGAVVVLPRLEDESIVMIRNLRHTVGMELLELPAGTIEPGEDPLACAARELEEETGYRAASITPYGEFFTSPGILTERMRAYVADDLTVTRQSLDDGEHIRVEIVPAAKARELVINGGIRDAKSLAVLGRYFLSQRG